MKLEPGSRLRGPPRISIRGCGAALGVVLLACGSCLAAREHRDRPRIAPLARVDLIWLTDQGELAGAYSYLRRDGRFVMTIITPAGDGRLAGTERGGRMTRAEAEQLFAGLERALPTIRMRRAPERGQTYPRHLWGSAVLRLLNGGPWLAADSAAAETLRPWVERINKSLRDALRRARQ